MSTARAPCTAEGPTPRRGLAARGQQQGERAVGCKTRHPWLLNAARLSPWPRMKLSARGLRTSRACAPPNGCVEAAGAKKRPDAGKDAAGTSTGTYVFSVLSLTSIETEWDSDMVRDSVNRLAAPTYEGKNSVLLCRDDVQRAAALAASRMTGNLRFHQFRCWPSLVRNGPGLNAD